MLRTALSWGWMWCPRKTPEQSTHQGLSELNPRIARIPGPPGYILPLWCPKPKNITPTQQFQQKLNKFLSNTTTLMCAYKHTYYHQIYNKIISQQFEGYTLYSVPGGLYVNQITKFITNNSIKQNNSAVFDYS